MSATASSPATSSYRPQTGFGPAAWTIVGVTTIGAAHAVKGIVQIGREILTADPTGPNGEAPARRPANGASHEMAGVFLIAGSAYLAKLMRRAIADVVDVAREIGARS